MIVLDSQQMDQSVKQGLSNIKGSALRACSFQNVVFGEHVLLGSAAKWTNLFSRLSIKKSCYFELGLKPEDHWSCIAHLIAEDMLKSAVIEEKTFKHSPWAGADNLLGPKF